VVVVAELAHVSTLLTTVVSKVTAAFSPKSEPETVVPVVAVMDCWASKMPLNELERPSVAEEPTCQIILHS
jgi:hypothetical protein